MYHKLIGVVIIVLAIVFLAPVGASAQDKPKEQSSWGVIGGIGTWHLGGVNTKLFLGDSGNLGGNDMQIGFYHGKFFGSDNGVIVGIKSLSSGQLVHPSNTCIIGPTGVQACINGGWVMTPSNSRMLSVEYFHYWNFSTIKRRVQVGLYGSLGYAQIQGQAVRVDTSGFFIGTTPHVTVTTLTVPATEMVLGRIEHTLSARAMLCASVIVSNNFKLRFGSGIGAQGRVPIMIQLIVAQSKSNK